MFESIHGDWKTAVNGEISVFWKAQRDTENIRKITVNVSCKKNPSNHVHIGFKCNIKQALTLVVVAPSNDSS